VFLSSDVGTHQYVQATVLSARAVRRSRWRRTWHSCAGGWPAALVVGLPVQGQSKLLGDPLGGSVAEGDHAHQPVDAQDIPSVVGAGCGVSTRSTGSPASPPTSSCGGCWPRPGRRDRAVARRRREPLGHRGRPAGHHRWAAPPGPHPDRGARLISAHGPGAGSAHSAPSARSRVNCRVSMPCPGPKPCPKGAAERGHDDDRSHG
jgi:hypothetical protein